MIIFEYRRIGSDASAWNAYDVFLDMDYIGRVFQFRYDHETKTDSWLAQSVHGVIYGYTKTIRTRHEAAKLLKERA